MSVPVDLIRENRMVTPCDSSEFQENYEKLGVNPKQLTRTETMIEVLDVVNRCEVVAQLLSAGKRISGVRLMFPRGTDVTYYMRSAVCIAAREESLTFHRWSGDFSVRVSAFTVHKGQAELHCVLRRDDSTPTSCIKNIHIRTILEFNTSQFVELPGATQYESRFSPHLMTMVFEPLSECPPCVGDQLFAEYIKDNMTNSAKDLVRLGHVNHGVDGLLVRTVFGNIEYSLPGYPRDVQFMIWYTWLATRFTVRDRSVYYASGEDHRSLIRQADACTKYSKTEGIYCGTLVSGHAQIPWDLPSLDAMDMDEYRDLLGYPEYSSQNMPVTPTVYAVEGARVIQDEYVADFEYTESQFVSANTPDSGGSVPLGLARVITNQKHSRLVSGLFGRLIVYGYSKKRSPTITIINKDTLKHYTWVYPEKRRKMVWCHCENDHLTYEGREGCHPAQATMYRFFGQVETLKYVIDEGPGDYSNFQSQVFGKWDRPVYLDQQSERMDSNSSLRKWFESRPVWHELFGNWARNQGIHQDPGELFPREYVEKLGLRFPELLITRAPFEGEWFENLPPLYAQSFPRGHKTVDLSPPLLEYVASWPPSYSNDIFVYQEFLKREKIKNKAIVISVDSMRREYDNQRCEFSHGGSNLINWMRSRNEEVT